jgi:predicted amidohydrolase YtcJ
VHMHAIGDRATRDALDAIEAARAANGPSDNRHHVAHLQIVHPHDVLRFGALGVIANMQPLWACMDPQMSELTLPRLGEERMGQQYPFGDLARTGATLAGGSDWPVSTPDPLLEMEVALTRVDPGARDAEPFLPDQRLTLTQAFAAFTMGSATVNHDDREAGSIEVGKRADLAVLDRDVFEPDAGPLGDARVLVTIAAGRVVYEGFPRSVAGA